MNKNRTAILVLAGVLLVATGIFGYNGLIPSFVARSVLFAVPMGCIIGGRFLNKLASANR